MYVVRITCKVCGRDSKFKSTDKERDCPLCGEENRKAIVAAIPRTKQAPQVKR